MTNLRAISLVVLGNIASLALAAAGDGEVTISFDKVETGKPMPRYTDQGVVFALAHQPSKSKAVGRVMFVTKDSKPSWKPCTVITISGTRMNNPR